LKVYLDACVLSRLSDDRTQARVAAEAATIEQIFRMIFLGEVVWSGSQTLRHEVNRNPDRDKRNDALALLAYADEMPDATEALRERAEILHTLGYGAFDALHLAHAESQGVEVLLTTDDRFMRLAARGAGKPSVPLMNPVDWLRR
jgi:predicted nucleic acid-binding protein